MVAILLGGFHDSHFLVFMFLYYPLLLSVDGTCDLLLTNRTILWNIITEVISCHLCHIVLVRSSACFRKPARVSERNGRGLKEGQEEKARYRVSTWLPGGCPHSPVAPLSPGMAQTQIFDVFSNSTAFLLRLTRGHVTQKQGFSVTQDKPQCPRSETAPGRGAVSGLGWLCKSEHFDA